jgi:arylsulfatase A-like enzyme
MKRIVIIFVVAILAISCREKESNPQPNIVYIMADDLAAQAISAYGGLYEDIAPTPNIDRLAKEGMLFSNAFCTNSICGPSRASILTGKYSHRNGFYKNEGGDPFDSTQVTFPKILKEAGYATAMVGKWHLWSQPTGFDYFKYHTDGGEQGVYWDPIFNENGKSVQEKGYATNLTADFALDWLENGRDKAKPFCLLFQFKAPHRPWQPDSIYQHIFDKIEMPYPATFNDDYSTRELTAGKTMMTIENHLNNTDLKIKQPVGLNDKELAKWKRRGDKGEYISPSDTLKGLALKQWKYQRYIKDYLACIKSVDDNIGRLLKYLDDAGLAKNTIVVFTSDQGFYLGEHGWFDKRFMYEQSFRMPLIVRYPDKIKQGTKVNDMVLNVDFAPTLLSLAHTSIPKEMQGKSFEPILFGKTPSDWRKSVYYHYYEYPKWHNVQPHYGIRTDRYKLIHFYYNVDVWELFDLKEDPNELKNKYNDSSYKAVIADLKNQMQKLQNEYGDTGSVNEMRKETEKGMVLYK